VVQGLGFGLEAGQSLGLVGASGSGKSLSALALMGLLPPGAKVRQGRICFERQELLDLPDEQRRLLRGGAIGLVFQEPFTALNPLMRVGAQIEESLVLRGMDAASAERAAAEALEQVGLSPGAERALQYPHQYSGGMRQRALLAMALAGQPRLLIADEPTTALDAPVQAQMLALIKGLQKRLGFALLIISHDLGVIHALAEEAVILEKGRVVERGTVTGLLNAPKSEALKRLLNAHASLAGMGAED